MKSIRNYRQINYFNFSRTQPGKDIEYQKKKELVPIDVSVSRWQSLLEYRLMYYIGFG